MRGMSPERYQKLKNYLTAVLEVHIRIDQQCYSIRVVRTQYGAIRRIYWTMATLGLLAPPILLYITWRKQLAVLQQVKDTKGGPSAMWACIGPIHRVTAEVRPKGMGYTRYCQ